MYITRSVRPLRCVHSTDAGVVARIQTGHETGSSHVIYPRRGSIDRAKRLRRSIHTNGLEKKSLQLKVRANHDFPLMADEMQSAGADWVDCMLITLQVTLLI